MTHTSKSPVSFVAHVARLPKGGLPVTIDAGPEAREILAREHELLSVQRFHTELLVTPWKRNGVKVEGHVEADITQECVVTLDSLDTAIRETFSQVYLPDDSKLGRLGFHAGGEILLDAEGPDSPETFSGDMLDVGALAEEFFALAIDPYPRKPGAALAPAKGGQPESGVANTLGEKLKILTRKS